LFGRYYDVKTVKNVVATSFNEFELERLFSIVKSYNRKRFTEGD